MKILFYSPHQEAGAWRDEIAHALPEAELRAWQPGDTDAADYALVWRAPREFFARMFGLDHGRLVGGGRSILDASDKLGQVLFESAAGVGSLGPVREELDARSVELWA
ncbi:AAA family ATPase, partial [Burkholderia pyrrocinia]|uniref:AAA family ATPase n=1 Tax=Burkholderia pyrrocinia TaxID=60550 RepID=UPI0020C6F6F9